MENTPDSHAPFDEMRRALFASEWAPIAVPAPYGEAADAYVRGLLRENARRAEPNYGYLGACLTSLYGEEMCPGGVELPPDVRDRAGILIADAFGSRRRANTTEAVDSPTADKVDMSLRETQRTCNPYAQVPESQIVLSEDMDDFYMVVDEVTRDPGVRLTDKEIRTLYRLDHFHDNASMAGGQRIIEFRELRNFRNQQDVAQIAEQLPVALAFQFDEAYAHHLYMAGPEAKWDMLAEEKVGWWVKRILCGSSVGLTEATVRTAWEKQSALWQEDGTYARLAASTAQDGIRYQLHIGQRRTLRGVRPTFTLVPSQTRGYTTLSIQYYSRYKASGS